MKDKKFDYKKNSKSSKPFVKDFREFSQNLDKASHISICDISVANKGDNFSIFGTVEKVVQTGGPTIFSVSDGTGILSLKAFDGAGVRAYPHVDVGDAIKAIVGIEEYNGELEGEVKKIWKLDDKDKEEFLEKLVKIEKDRAKVKEIPFLAESPILDKLRAKIIKAATEIRLAVIQSRPIIVRHHNDTDGYSAGFALERAILPLIEKQHLGNTKAAWEYFARAPCAAPFYELEDSIKDTSLSLRNAAKFSNKMPLIIIVDNGSGQEDLMGILQGKVHGSDFIVVDHHGFDKDVITEHVLTHVNPHLEGESGASISAGMLCVELARLVNNETKNITQIPALAGLADRIDLENEPLVKKYLEIAEKEGYSKDLLRDLSLVIEYVSTRIRFMEAREYFEVVFGEPRAQQKKLVALMAPHIKELDAKGLAIAKENAIIEEIQGITVQKIMIEETFPGFGFFPKPGRSVGLVHDFLKNTGKTKLISVGVMNTAITFRATNEANFSVHDFLSYVNEKLPTAFAEGGGHKNAGSINYLPKYKDKVLALFEEFINGKK